ncbi:DUF1624 domain-containing protein [Agaribacterium sp. ZY112]|uniref:DUF1624 domain-containing protein n=1 Tax=Agaribacterium sp. ZY112 TaxID=3233574 RepID=UPI003525DD84
MANSKRIAAIDWMRGFVMIIMVLDHVSMAYDANHLVVDSATSYSPGDPLPAFAFFTRWLSHVCAPTFVFLAGTALAISVERKVSKGIDPWGIDKDIILRGLVILLMDLTIVSFFSGRFTIQVLYAIGASFICMAMLRRLSSAWLIGIALAWIAGGELLTAQFWPPGQNIESVITALLFSKYSSADLRIIYPLFPWLSIMILGWVFGRYIVQYKEAKTKLDPQSLLIGLGILALIAFSVVRYLNGYGNMFLYRDDTSWQHWLHVSKYPPSAAYILLELGIMSLLLALMMKVEKLIGVRDKGVLLVFGQTAMIFYLVHRVILTGTATYAGMSGFTDLQTCYLITFVMLLALYPFCLWYRGFKARNPQSLILKYL